jgi:hypothetical protein
LNHQTGSPHQHRAKECKLSSGSLDSIGDDGYYETGVKVSGKELAALELLTCHEFHKNWNQVLNRGLHDQSNVR